MTDRKAKISIKTSKLNVNGSVSGAKKMKPTISKTNQKETGKKK